MWSSCCTRCRRATVRELTGSAAPGELAAPQLHQRECASVLAVVHAAQVPEPRLGVGADCRSVLGVRIDDAARDARIGENMLPQEPYEQRRAEPALDDVGLTQDDVAVRTSRRKAGSSRSELRRFGDRRRRARRLREARLERGPDLRACGLCAARDDRLSRQRPQPAEVMLPPQVLRARAAASRLARPLHQGTRGLVRCRPSSIGLNTTWPFSSTMKPTGRMSMPPPPPPTSVRPGVT